MLLPEPSQAMTHAHLPLQDLLGARYRLDRELGGGSMAVVYLAEDLRHGRMVALKVLKPEYAATFAAERFLREIEIAARLQHPHIVPLLDSGDVGGHLYLVMPYIEGETLRARLLRDRQLNISEVIRTLADVADALSYAHRKGIVHRDIKPDNILVAGRHALVTDFGVAKAVSAATLAPRDLTVGVALGTPAYMAPEQATADPNLDHRVDLYALGVVGYELLAGAPPFDGPTAQAILTAHVLDAPQPIEERRRDVPVLLATIIGRALAKRPEERWETADELLHQLEPLATPSGGSTPASVTPVVRPARVFAWGAGVVLALAALAVGIRIAVPRPVTAGPMIAQRQLTFSGNTVEAALSPDGELLAYVTADQDSNHLRVQDQRGGTTITLASGANLRGLSWSRNGAEVRYQVRRGTSTVELRGVPRLGGSYRVVTPVPGSVVSASGEWLAEMPRGRNGVTFVNLRSGDSVAVELAGFRWHSDPSLSSDGEYIAFATTAPAERHTGVAIVSRRDLRLRELVRDSVPIGTPTWSPDGAALFYLRSQGGLSDLMRIAIDHAGRVQGPATVVAPGLQVEPDFVPQLSVTADGTRIVYTRRDRWSNLALVSLDHLSGVAGQHLLTMGSALYIDARLSPDGRTIAFIRDNSTGASVELQPVAGGDSRQLARLRSAYGVTWSPDGQRLLGTSIDSSGQLRLRVFPIEGGPSRTYPYPVPGGYSGWISDTLAAVDQDGNRGLWLVDVRTGDARMAPGADTTIWAFWPIGAPGGRRLAFTRNLAGGIVSICVLTLGDPVPREILRGPYKPISWSADGRSVFATDVLSDQDSVRLLAVPTDGGAARTIASYPRGVAVLDFSAEHRLALLNIHTDRGDAWQVELAPTER
jgi:Tol biopolymer transport system component